MRLKTIVLLLILALIAAPALANDQPTPVPAPTPCPTPAATPCPLSPEPLETTPPINCNCAAALLCEQDSGQVIFCMNPDVPRPVASVTKVMTLLLTLEQIDAGRDRKSTRLNSSHAKTSRMPSSA